MDWMNLAKLAGGIGGAAFTGGATIPLAMQGASGLLSGAAKGSADERSKENVALGDRDKTKANIYGTQQGALLNALLASGKDKLSRYDTQQGATTQAMQGRQGAWNTALGNESNEKIALAKLGIDAPAANAKASILGSLMKNYQPHQLTSPAGQIGHITQIKGGPGALDPLTRQHGEALMQSALQKQLGGGGLPGATNFREGIQDWDKAILDAPGATDYSKGLMLPPELADYKKAGKGESILSGLGLGLGLAGTVAGSFGGGGGDGGSSDGGRSFSNAMPSNPANADYGFKLPRLALEEAFTDYPDHP